MKRIKRRFILIIFLFFVLAYNLSMYFTTFSEYVSKTNATATLIDGEVVTINNLTEDYNYYMGLNYTYTTDGTLPTNENKNIYNNNNLVETKISYYGYDLNNNNYAFVSLEEEQNTYIYHNIYPVNNNGTTTLSDDYLEIELIDNPFTDRPNDLAFNGWITKYKGAKISYDSDYYTRKVKIPVTYTDNIPDPIEIEFYTNWIEAKVGYINSSSNWASAFSSLDEGKMQPIGGEKPKYESVEELYFRDTVSYRTNYPEGAVNDRGQSLTGRCNSFFSSCTYYIGVGEGSVYTEGLTYYKLSGNGNNATMQQYNVQITGYEEIPKLTENTPLAGFYNKRTIANGSSINGYYSENGSINTGTCTTSGGCEVYELMQYYNNSDEVNKADGETIYYYLATRDTNIIVMNTSVDTKWSSNENKPFTLTSVHNNRSYIETATWTVSNQYITCYNDVVIENIKINSGASNSSSNPSSSQSANGYIYANYNNLKIGRGISQYLSYKTFNGVYGGNNNTSGFGSRTNITKYTLKVESGWYNTITLTNGPANTNNNKYIEAKGIYGNDYDKIRNDNNSLDVYFEASGSWGAGNYYASTNEGITFDTTIKSGSYGTGKYDHTTGVYVGGRSYGTHYTSRKIKVEGGWIYNLIGGPLTASDRKNINDTYINITGGEVDMVIGGAGTSTTYGNRIISVTGGTVNYSVFGGSNSYEGNSSDGKLTGSSFVYIGGNSKIGKSELIDENETLWGAESGSVFGIGNGNSSTSSIGTNENSNIIIADKTNILGNVYGGGNYSATGISSEDTKTETNIKVIGGTVNGSVYGGGNKNGSGSNSIESLININILNGNIKGSVYGGSRETGTIYGNIKLDINGGNLDGSVYGGGQGSSTNVTKNINITYGNDKIEDLPVLKNNLYGGSELGTVNDMSSNINITVNKGEIEGSLFGGAKGNDTTIPKVNGNITININGGKINSIFGGNDYSGTPSKDVKIYLYGGEINTVYGGGNKTSLTTSNIYLDGSQVNTIHGGSNEAGDVNKANILITKGTVNTVYGGNNLDGVTDTTNIEVIGGEIGTIYGGGNETETNIANINIKGSTITNIYGGGNNAGINNAYINLYNGEITNVYGGSNKSGDVSNVEIKTYKTEKEEDEEEPEETPSEPEEIPEENNKQVDVSVEYSLVEVNPYWQDTNYNTVATIKYSITNNTDTVLEDYNGYIKIKDSTLYSNYSGTKLNENNSTYTFDQSNVYDENNKNSVNPNETYTFEFSVYTKMTIDEFKIDEYGLVDENTNNNDQNNNNDNNENEEPEEDEEVIEPTINYLKVDNIYGGNNEGGTTNKSLISLSTGEYGNIYGGGNKATLNIPEVILGEVIVTGNVYGGGNESTVTENTKLIIEKANIKGSVFGGGHAGVASKDTDVLITSSTIEGSVYAGGDGTTAVVLGNSKLIVENNSQIGKHVFGGGNAANTGTVENNNSTTKTYITGATIKGNVYGGGNTSILYGKSLVNIGIDVSSDIETTKGNIIINGTVFGGGEANEAGSEIYDFSHIGVTDGTTINIDGNNHERFEINGSIFGSGNASSTTGTSLINISNYGKGNNYKTNVSIQRADLVTIDNSVIEVLGATDRTNEYSTVLFSLSRIKHLKLKNNSTLYLKNGTNLLEEYTSAVDINGEEQLANVSINGKEIIKNVDNKIFIQGGKNLNIATNENASAYGNVNGMTFFGLYEKDRNNMMATGYYDTKYKDGDTISNNDLYMFASGSYVLGYHKVNHDITKDGFYSHFSEEGILNIDYVDPTPDDSTYYMWSIGEQVVTIEMTLTASKYVTLGTEELSLLNYSKPNTTFSIVGFNYNDLDSNVNLVKEEEIPRIAPTTEIADNTMSLVMKSTSSGWLNNGETTFLTTENNNIEGTTLYKSENSTDPPALQFYLYHSKNLGTSGSMGSATVSLVVVTPIDDISNKVERVNIVINLNRELYTTNDYEAAMTVGKEYSMFASSNVNLTTNGSFSAYYSLYVPDGELTYKDGYHRSLVSTYAFPVNTKLTLINLNGDSVNEYYYYVVNQNDYNEALTEYNRYGECSYDFSKFIRMGSTSNDNKYSDSINNEKYYDPETKSIYEEFIVIVDFIDSNINENVIDRSLLVELRNKEDETIVNVLGIEQERMEYSLYTNSNAIIDVEGEISSNNIYPGRSVKLDITTNFNKKIIGSEIIHDTNYLEQQLGVKISYLDENNKQVTGASLLGVTYTYDGITYYPRMDGSVRIKLAERVANVSSTITINTTENVAAGNYTMVIESFGSSDGIYYGEVSSDTATLDVNVLDTLYGLSLKMGDHIVMIDKTTGNNLNENNNLQFNLKYTSALNNPHLRISLQRRTYNIIYSLDYEPVDLKDYIEENLNSTTKEYEYLLTDTPLKDITYNFKFKENLKTGTYKLVISLYDNNTYIGEVYKYIIIKEKYDE